MSSFICPICDGDLTSDGRSLKCAQNHSFDTARSGYTNLLTPRQSKTGQHGDDKVMVRSRQSFLDKGYYAPLLSGLCGIVLKYARDGGRILDAGCGECWYTAGIYRYLLQNGISPSMSGVDISKEALAAGAKRCRDIELCAASVFDLPVRDSYCDMLLCFFAPFSAQEYLRVLDTGGVLIRAFPLERHLWSLKCALYDKPYLNEADSAVPQGFGLLEKSEVRDKIRLSCNEDIKNVFTMTPYYYRTSPADKSKLDTLEFLDTEIEFGIEVYRK